MDQQNPVSPIPEVPVNNLKTKFKKFYSNFKSLPVQSKRLLSLAAVLFLVVALPVIVLTLVTTKTYFFGHAASGEASGEPPTPTAIPTAKPAPTPTYIPIPSSSPVPVKSCSASCNSVVITGNCSQASPCKNTSQRFDSLPKVTYRVTYQNCPAGVQVDAGLSPFIGQNTPTGTWVYAADFPAVNTNAIQSLDWNLCNSSVCWTFNSGQPLYWRIVDRSNGKVITSCQGSYTVTVKPPAPAPKPPAPVPPRPVPPHPTAAPTPTPIVTHFCRLKAFGFCLIPF